MEEQTCLNCGKPTPKGLNYCDWPCQLDHAKKQGGRVHTPNGLPIKCIRHDGLMLEHEHGDHPDYKFPVEVEFIGEITDDDRQDAEMMGYKAPVSDEDVRASKRETHALIYTDGSVVVTMYECCYAFWYLRQGECAGGSLVKPEQWRLSESSRRNIAESVAARPRSS
jgi:hypothetical protein